MRWKSPNLYCLQIFAIFSVFVSYWLSGRWKIEGVKKAGKSLVFASKLIGIATKSPTKTKFSVGLSGRIRNEYSWTSCFFQFLCPNDAILYPHRHFSERKTLQKSNLRFVTKLADFAYNHVFLFMASVKNIRHVKAPFPPLRQFSHQWWVVLQTHHLSWTWAIGEWCSRLNNHQGLQRQRWS